MLVRRFLERLAKASPPERADIVRALVRVYFEVDLDEQQRAEVERTFMVILDDPAPRVRRALSEAIAPARYAPRSLVRALLADRADIAEPLLRNSPLLADDDLVTLVDGFEEPQRLSVASRPAVGVALSAALVEVAEPQTCLALLENPGATIAASTFRRLVERHRRDSGVRTALLERDDLPVVLRQMLVDGVSEELEASPLVMAFLSPEKTQRILSDARDQAAVDLAADCDPRALRQHVEALHADGRLGAAMLVRAAAAGNPAMLAEALSILARVPPARAATLLHGKSRSALRALWKRAGLAAFALDPFVGLLPSACEGKAAGEADLESAYALCRHATEEGSEALRQLLSRLAREQARAAARMETGGYFNAA